jgi:hypothetical protein
VLDPKFTQQSRFEDEDDDEYEDDCGEPRVFTVFK